MTESQYSNPDPTQVDLESLYFQLHKILYGPKWGMDRQYPEDFEETKPGEYRLLQDTLKALIVETEGYHGPLFSLGMLYRDAGEHQLAETFLIWAALALSASGLEDDKYEEDECWEAVCNIALERGELFTAGLAWRRIVDRELRADLEAKWRARIEQQNTNDPTVRASKLRPVDPDSTA